MTAGLYVERSPVAAKLVECAEDWRWSSVHAHVSGAADGLTDLAGLAEEMTGRTLARQKPGPKGAVLKLGIVSP